MAWRTSTGIGVHQGIPKSSGTIARGVHSRLLLLRTALPVQRLQHPRVLHVGLGQGKEAGGAVLGVRERRVVHVQLSGANVALAQAQADHRRTWLARSVPHRPVEMLDDQLRVQLRCSQKALAIPVERDPHVVQASSTLLDDVLNGEDHLSDHAADGHGAIRQRHREPDADQCLLADRELSRAAVPDTRHFGLIQAARDDPADGLASDQSKVSRTVQPEHHRSRLHAEVEPPAAAGPDGAHRGVAHSNEGPLRGSA
mmetsp:Transcript_138210/g.440918  ORF Transcript_138210/g.440918 Transcript_138210/m.440918 type:complete len:256 (-) Transcript_138210:11-778(-)